MPNARHVEARAASPAPRSRRPGRPVGARLPTDPANGFHRDVTDNGRASGANAECAQKAVTTCRECGTRITGTVFVTGNVSSPWAFRCERCQLRRFESLAEGLGLPSVARWDASPCENCGRAVVVLGFRDRRVRHLVCSPACRDELRGRSRRVRHEPRVCPGCELPFTPNRSDSVFCSTRCRVRVWRRGE